MTPADMLKALENGTLDPSEFSHRDHVVVAYECLQQSDFFRATTRIADGLRALTEKAGVPEKFNATITFAFMSRIAEYMHDGATSAEDLLQKNPQLLGDLDIRKTYDADRLSHPLAVQIALLP